MDTREESQKYPKGTPVIFLPSPENDYYKHSGKEGTIQFQRMNGTQWYIDLTEKIWIRKGSPKEKEIPIRVLGVEKEFKVII